MAKTNFQNGDILTPEYMNIMRNHVHDDGDEDGHASKIDIRFHTEGTLPGDRVGADLIANHPHSHKPEEVGCNLHSVTLRHGMDGIGRPAYIADIVIEKGAHPRASLSTFTHDRDDFTFTVTGSGNSQIYLNVVSDIFPLPPYTGTMRCTFPMHVFVGNNATFCPAILVPGMEDYNTVFSIMVDLGASPPSGTEITIRPFSFSFVRYYA